MEIRIVIISAIFFIKPLFHCETTLQEEVVMRLCVPSEYCMGFYKLVKFGTGQRWQWMNYKKNYNRKSFSMKTGFTSVFRNLLIKKIKYAALFPNTLKDDISAFPELPTGIEFGFWSYFKTI